MLVNPAQVAGNLPGKISLNYRTHLATGQDDLQTGVKRFLVSRLAHPCAQQHLAVGDGGEHIHVPAHVTAGIMAGVIVVGVTVVAVVRFLALDLFQNPAVRHAEDVISRRHAEMAADGATILGYGCNFGFHVNS
jgi:hypothetical protein